MYNHRIIATFFTLQVKAFIYCNGYRWNGSVPNCQRRRSAWGPETKCSFAGNDLCGWEQYVEDGLDWDFVQDGRPLNATMGTGPIKDTSRAYLHFESSGNLTENSTAAIFSPIFPASYSSRACFVLVFNMNGVTMGVMTVYVVPESASNYNMSSLLARIVGDQVELNWHFSKFLFTRK